MSVTYKARICGCCLIMLTHAEGCPSAEDRTQHPEGLMGLMSEDHVTPDYCADHDTDGVQCSCNGHPDALRRYNEDDGCETFSTARCDGCGTWLAGDRYRVEGRTP